MPWKIAPVLLAVALVPAPALSQNLLVNPGFDDDVSGWQAEVASEALAVDWVADDALGQPGSGALRLTDVLPDEHSNVYGVGQCLPVTAGAAYDLSGWVRIPAGQVRAGTALLQVIWYADAACSQLVDFDRAETTDTSGEWRLLGQTGLVAPAGAQWAEVDLDVGRFGAPGPFAALFDEIALCPAGTCAQPGPPEPPYAQWLRSPELPGFSAQVRITPQGGSPLRGSEEADCIAETICVRGALAGRPELFAKVIGPRPNGFLWAQIIRFTPSQTEIWLRQDDSGEVRYYLLPAVAPSAGELPGVEDRTAFAP